MFCVIHNGVCREALTRVGAARTEYDSAGRLERYCERAYNRICVAVRQHSRRCARAYAHVHVHSAGREVGRTYEWT